jgi:hypothetical protein
MPRHVLGALQHLEQGAGTVVVLRIDGKLDRDANCVVDGRGGFR